MEPNANAAAKENFWQQTLIQQEPQIGMKIFANMNANYKHASKVQALLIS